MYVITKYESTLRLNDVAAVPSLLCSAVQKLHMWSRKQSGRLLRLGRRLMTSLIPLLSSALLSHTDDLATHMHSSKATYVCDQESKAGE